MFKAAIISFEGETLTPTICEVFQEHKPIGVILMGSNVASQDPIKIKTMVDEIRTYVPFVLIDQEGGPVRRLRGDAFYNAPAFGELPKNVRTFEEHGKGIGIDLQRCGINVDCAPCADILFDKSPDHVLSNRAIEGIPEEVSNLSEAFCQGLMSQGCVPVMKHLPGHGRCQGDDPHLGTCFVEESLDVLKQTDFKPFAHLAETFGTRIWGMVSHVWYKALNPGSYFPATFSKEVVSAIRHDIGFNSFLVSDAIDMEALGGPMEERALKTVEAGLDSALYCGRDIKVSRKILETVPYLNEESLIRLKETLPQ